MKLAQKVVVAIAVPVFFQIGYFWFVLDSVRKLDNLEKAGRDAAHVMMLRDQLYVADSEQLFFYGLYRATMNPVYSKKFQQCVIRSEDAYSQLFDMWKGQKVKTQILASAYRNFQMIKQFGRDMVKLKPETESTMFYLISGPTALPMGPYTLVAADNSNLLLAFDEFARSQKDLTRKTQIIEAELNQLLLFGLIASVLLGLGCGLLFSQSVTERLKLVVCNIKSMEKHENERLPVSGSDEIAALNSAILDTDKKIRSAEEFQVQTARIVATELERPIDQLSAALVELRARGFESLNDNGKERVERSSMELQRLRTLVKDLVSLDKISRAGWDLEIEVVDLAEIARGAVDTVVDFARSLDVEIVCNLAAAPVKGDPARLQQIALNLLTNAIKFSKPKKIIEVETKVEKGLGLLSVTDHGTGIPEEFQQSIFGKFEQAARTDSTEKGGSGLGLAISRKLVESQHGKMGFHSKLGEGSTFWLQLPITAFVDNVGSTPCVDQGEIDVGSTPCVDQGEIDVGSTPCVDLETQKSPSGANVSSAQQATYTQGREREFRPTLRRKVLILVALPIIVQISTTASLWLVIYSIRSNVNEVHRAAQITSCHSGIVNATMKSALFSMVYNVTHAKKTYEEVQKQHRLIADLIDQLNAISLSSNVLKENIQQLKSTIKEHVDLQYQMMRADQNTNIDIWFGPKTRGETERKVQQLENSLQSAITYEKNLAENNILARTEYRKGVEAVVLASMICMFLISVVLAVFMIKRLTSRVRRIVTNADRLVQKQSLLEPLPGTDEVAYVDQAFFDAANKLIQLERFKQEIIAITSHEFRTPLTSLLAKTDLMEAGVFGVLTERGKEIVRASKRSIIDLIALITNLLDVEKMQSGKHIVEINAALIDEILSKAAENVAELAGEREVAFRTSFEELNAKVDSTRLIQALTAVLTDITEHAAPKSTIVLDAKKQGEQLEVLIVAPGGDCSKDSLDVATARGRLAVDLMTLIAEQHGGSLEINPSAEKLVVSINL